jgi:hypothetical protein
MSRGFACALFGVAMTIFSWFSPWSWPAWPAFGAMALLFGTHTSFAALPFAVRGAFVVLFIAVNIAAWALAAMAVWSAVQCLTGRRRPPLPD